MLHDYSSSHIYWGFRNSGYLDVLIMLFHELPSPNSLNSIRRPDSTYLEAPWWLLHSAGLQLPVRTYQDLTETMPWSRLVALSCRKPLDLQDLAPGTKLPFLTFDSEVFADVNKIEELLEERLIPPRYMIQSDQEATKTF